VAGVIVTITEVMKCLATILAVHGDIEVGALNHEFDECHLAKIVVRGRTPDNDDAPELGAVFVMVA
jgi:hypothetical protein